MGRRTMGEFFRGWRRKAGCGLLVMACVLGSLWTRSNTNFDSLRFAIGEDEHRWSSSKDYGFAWETWKRNDPEHTLLVRQTPHVLFVLP
jgi:hypothetical protein